MMDHQVVDLYLVPMVYRTWLDPSVLPMVVELEVEIEADTDDGEILGTNSGPLTGC